MCPAFAFSYLNARNGVTYHVIQRSNLRTLLKCLVIFDEFVRRQKYENCNNYFFIMFSFCSAFMHLFRFILFKCSVVSRFVECAIHKISRAFEKLCFRVRSPVFDLSQSAKTTQNTK